MSSNASSSNPSSSNPSSNLSSSELSREQYQINYPVGSNADTNFEAIFQALLARLMGAQSISQIRHEVILAIQEVVQIQGTELYLEEDLSLGQRYELELEGPRAFYKTIQVQGQIIGFFKAVAPLDAPFDSIDLAHLSRFAQYLSIAIENLKRYLSLKQSFHDTLGALAETIEKKDPYTGGHTKRVVSYSLEIARYLNLSPTQIEDLKVAALLHDIGKIGIDDQILRKSSSLDETEWQQMKNHAEIGYDITCRVRGLGDVVLAIRHHHERWDGTGYPKGLKEMEIPFLSRLIAVADTFDAMVSTRPYRQGTSARLAFDEIVRNRGIQFDPEVVDAFKKAYLSGALRDSNDC